MSWSTNTGFLLSIHIPAQQLPLTLLCLVTLGLCNPVLADHKPMSLDWQPAAASPTNFCSGYYLPYQPNQQDQHLSSDQQPLFSNADVSVYDQGITNFTGNVEFSQGPRQITGDAASFDSNNGQVNIKGHVTMRRSNMIIQSQTAGFNTNHSEAQLNQAQLAITDNELRATAQFINYHSDDTVTLTKGSFTFCPPSENAWAIHSNTINIDPTLGMAEAQHAILKVGVVPVFYLPWMSFPINDQRRSGFLFPTLQSSTSTGLDITTPYYLNLAPNYDALITPRFTEFGGTSLSTEFRHLSENTQQDLSINWAIDDLNTDQKRWLLEYNREAKFSSQLSSSIHIKRVSDFGLFSDYNLAQTSAEKTSIISNAELNYKGQTALINQASLAVITRQNTGAGVPAYDQLPHATLSGGGLIIQGQQKINADYNVDLSRFTRNTDGLTGSQKITGLRTHLLPSLAAAWVNNYSFIKPKISLPITNYQLNNTPAGISAKNTRVIPQFEIDSGLLFERQLAGGYLQTLQPRLYYAYAPYQQQNDVAVFDTSVNASPFYQPNRFNGFDRIGDTNRVTLGLDSQFLSAQGWQKAKLSIRQMHYLSDRKVELTSGNVTDTADLSPIYGSMAYNFNRYWSSNLSINWSPDFTDIQSTSANIKYQSTGNKVLDFKYSEVSTGTQQAEVSLIWPLAPQWTLVAKRKEDIRNQQLQDEILGLRYVNCCWQASLVNRYWLVDQAKGIEHGVFFELSLKGLGKSNQQLTPGEKVSLGDIMKGITG